MFRKFFLLFGIFHLIEFLLVFKDLVISFWCGIFEFTISWVFDDVMEGVWSQVKLSLELHLGIDLFGLVELNIVANSVEMHDEDVRRAGKKFSFLHSDIFVAITAFVVIEVLAVNISFNCLFN